MSGGGNTSGSYARGMNEVIRDQCCKNLLALDRLWIEMGLSDNEIRDRIGTVGKQVSDVTKRMVECDTINRDKMVSRCKDQRQQIVNKIKVLGLEMKMEQISSNLPLAEQNKLLQDQLNEIEQRESEMMAKYRVLMEEELKLTTMLDVRALNLGHIPSINNIEMLAENNKKLQRLAEEREQCMFSMKEEIVELLDDLEMDLNATSLDILLITDDQKFDSLRQCDLDSVRNTLEDLREQVVKREAEVKEMVEKLVALYERLDVSPEDQCPLSSGRVCGLNELGKSENLEQVKKELKRMISLRAVNMRQIMEKSEAELVVLWNDCMVGPNVRKQFLDSAVEDPDKELERLDVAIKEMQDYKERNRNIFKDLQKFLDRCKLAKELQLRLLDPNRLFKSRGNAMAKEEADRKLVNTLPALKEELLELARTREDLIVNDVTMSQLIEDNCRLLEQIYESSLSRTTVSHNKTKTNSVKSNSSLRSLNSPRSTKRVGRLLTSPGVRRPLTRANSTLMSSGRMTGSTKTLGTRTKRQNESPLSRPGKTLVQSSTMPRLHGRNPKILVSDASCNMQDASTIDESAFKENVPSNSTLISASHLSSPPGPGLGAVRELSFEQERLRLAMAELKVNQQKTLSMSKREHKDFSQMEASLKSKAPARRKHRRSNSCSDLRISKLSASRTTSGSMVGSFTSVSGLSKSANSNSMKRQGSKLRAPSPNPTLTRTASSTNLFLR